MANNTSITHDVVTLMMNIGQVTKSEKIAEYTSSCPDLPIKFHCKVNNAREALAALFVMVTVVPERSGFARMSFTDHLARMCFNHSYEGNWSTVQEILQLRTMTPYSVGKVLLSKMSKNDFYGNFVPLVIQVSKTIRAVKVYPQRKYYVREPQRKRGYDDKGTLRLSHQWLPTDIHLGENPIKEDRRAKSYTPRNQHYWFEKYLKRRDQNE